MSLIFQRTLASGIKPVEQNREIDTVALAPLTNTVLRAAAGSRLVIGLEFLSAVPPLLRVGLVR